MNDDENSTKYKRNTAGNPPRGYPEPICQPFLSGLGTWLCFLDGEMKAKSAFTQIEGTSAGPNDTEKPSKIRLELNYTSKLIFAVVS